MADVTAAIVREAQRLEEDTLYLAKGHPKASPWKRLNVVVGTAATIAAALAAVFTLIHNRPSRAAPTARVDASTGPTSWTGTGARCSPVLVVLTFERGSIRSHTAMTQCKSA